MECSPVEQRHDFLKELRATWEQIDFGRRNLRTSRWTTLRGAILQAVSTAARRAPNACIAIV
jgi:hypothetical protein